MRRLPVLRLRDRYEIGVAVVIEGNDAAQRISDGVNAAERVVVHGNVVAVAVFYLDTAILAVNFPEAQPGTVSGMDQQRTSVFSEPQIRRISRIIDSGGAQLAQFHAPADGSD